jgi:hypothetical protein
LGMASKYLQTHITSQMKCEDETQRRSSVSIFKRFN